MKPSVTVIPILLLTLVSACTAPLQRNRYARDHNVITREQIVANHFTSAFEAVQSLHSNWLHARDPNSTGRPGRVLVYFDNVKLGGIESLHDIRCRTVSYIRYYNGIEATTRWGLDHGGGVIQVSTQPVVLPTS